MMNWHVIRIAYFDKDKSNVMLNGIQPALQHFQNENTVRCYISRHWKFGPHIDINLSVKDQASFQVNYQAFTQQLAHWLAENPSTTKLNDEEYLVLSERLGKAELDPGPYAPLLEDNSISLTKYENPVELFGGEGMLRVKQDFQHQFTEFLFPLVKIREASYTQFINTLVEMFACIANTYSFEKIKKGHLSLRSHVEFFLANYDKGEQLKSRLEDMQSAHASEADKALERVVSEFQSLNFYQGKDDFFVRWIELLFNARAQITDEVLLNFERIQNPNRVFDYAQKHIAKGDDDKFEPEQGKFFDKFSESDREKLFSKPQFIIYRTLVNQFYVSLVTLGISPLEKHGLCEIVSKATERFYDVHWQQQVTTNSPATKAS